MNLSDWKFLIIMMVKNWVSNNGASDLISVKTSSKKICLIPFVSAIVPVVDIENKKIMINNLEGLLE